ncbi:UNVERIFIED_CONTAM: hypothetical protein H355_004177 [Colinus virginianus]|nr:hypothetical protein H355_004177 [Colinus virginianus]
MLAVLIDVHQDRLRQPCKSVFYCVAFTMSGNSDNASTRYIRIVYSALVADKNSDVANVKPKVLESYSHENAKAPRKVTVERKMRFYASLEIEKLLTERGIDCGRPSSDSGSWRYAESLIQYNYYIDNMPITDANGLDVDQAKRIADEARHIASRRKTQMSVTTVETLIAEFNLLFARTMNKIAFDKRMNKRASDVAYKALVLPPKLLGLPPKNTGLLEIPFRDFAATFSAFCFSSLLVKHEVIRSLIGIRAECNAILERRIYCTNIPKLSADLQDTWAQNIYRVISTHLSGVGKGWFNLYETNKETYEYGKTKKLLSVASLLMQDSLRHMTLESLEMFVRRMEAYTAGSFNFDSILRLKDIVIPSPFDEQKGAATGGDTSGGLFVIDITRGPSDKGFQFNVSPDLFLKAVLDIFEKGLKHLLKLFEEHAYILELKPEDVAQQLARRATGPSATLLLKQAVHDYVEAEFAASLQDLENLVEVVSHYDDMTQMEEINSTVLTVSERLSASVQLAKLYNDKELLFGTAVTDYSRVQRLVKELEPIANFWSTAFAWSSKKVQWLEGPFVKIDSQLVEHQVNGGIQLMHKVTRSVEDRRLESIREHTATLLQDLKRFSPLVPLILALRQEGMRMRHWDKISTAVGKKIWPGMENFTLSKLLELKITQFEDIIVETGDVAAREFLIEKALKKMKTEWERVTFNFTEKYKLTDTYILKGTEEIIALFDEHIALTQTLQFSPDKRPFEEEIEAWCSELLLASETLDEWLKCQRSWMYLQPVFDSPDIVKQLPSETKRFRSVDTGWRVLMRHTIECPLVLSVCSTSGLLDKLRDYNDNLEKAQHGLESYLDVKRSQFARLYFLSNDELLGILSETKDAGRVQPYLCKVFENVDRLLFEDTTTATAMYSPDGKQTRVALTLTE